MRADVHQLSFVDRRLRTLIEWMEEEIGVEFIATSLYRIGDPGNHGQLPLRAIDLRMRSQLIGESIERFVNDHWDYDPQRPDMKCVILHGPALHLHVQVSGNTRRKPVGM